MISTMTTNDVRRKLESLGAVRPGRKAVEIVAEHRGDLKNTSYWEMRLADEVIKSAIRVCAGRKGSDSYRTFASACKPKPKPKPKPKN